MGEASTSSEPVILGVIPARAGSKGIQNKNLRQVLGAPLISYTIRDALTYPSIYRVTVNTDSPEIAAVAKQYGAEVPFIRSSDLAQDDTPMLDVLKDALLRCEENYQVKIDGIALFDPTSPLRDRNDIEKMIRVFLQKKPDLVVAVARSRRNPYFNMVKIIKTGFAKLVLKGNFTRRQDAPPIFDIANNCWIFSRRAVLRGWRLPARTLVHEISGPWIDIDTEADLGLFEHLLREAHKCIENIGWDTSFPGD